MRSLFVILIAIPLLAGCTTQCVFWCHDGTEIQARYVNQRDECQNTAERVVSITTRAQVSAKERNTRLLEAFAKCMKTKNWGVTSPKKTETKKGGPNDNSQLSGNPWAPSPYGIQQQPQQVPYQYPQQAYTPAYNPYPQGYSQQPYYVQQPQQYRQQQIMGQQRQLPPPQQPYYSPQAQQQPQLQYRPQAQPRYQAPYQPNSNVSSNSDVYGLGGGDLENYDQNSNRAGIGLGPGY